MSLHNTEGKSTIATLFAVILFVSLGFILGSSDAGQAQSVQATSTATTSVTVLNRPPNWTLTARELYASATSTPTNSGTSTVWTAIATDNNNESYFLLVCKASGTPTHPNWVTIGDDPTPRCQGGLSQQWGISAVATSSVAATVSTTTTETMGEINYWFAYICDYNTSSPRCNSQMTNGLQEGWPPSATSSPFVINRRPVVTAVPTNNSPTLPGGVVTWDVSVRDDDAIRGGDTLQVHVCKTQDFSTTTLSCPGGTWATSSLTTVVPTAPQSVLASTTIPIPSQDATTTSYIYVVDTFAHRDLAYQGYNAPLGILNAAPYVIPGSIDLFDVFGSTSPQDYVLNLRVPEGQTNNFVIQFTVNDDNGCKNTLNANEVTAAFPNVFRSSATCYNAGHYNANNCYTHLSGSFTPWTCYQTSTSTCTSLVATADWECTYSLWYVADPTDVGSVFATDDWKAAIRAEDDDADTGVYATSTASSTLEQFLAFRATGSPIAYGSWEPADGTPYHPATTTLYAIGNTGLNQRVDGTAMCTTQLGCTMNGTSTIWAPSQRYATVTPVVFGPGTLGLTSFQLATSTATSTGTFVNLDIGKTTDTVNPKNANTYWGIYVPSSITYAGDYFGTNYIYGEIAPSGEW